MCPIGMSVSMQTNGAQENNNSPTPKYLCHTSDIQLKHHMRTYKVMEQICLLSQHGKVSASRL
jgi:hypothetical protein